MSKQIILSFLLLLPLVGVAQDEPTSGEAVVLDSIAAVVNEGIVLRSEFESQLRNVRRGLEAQGVAIPPEKILREQVLESLVIKRIQLQRAERLGLNVSDEALNQSLEQIARRGGLTLSQLPAALALDGIDYAQFREEARNEMILEQLRLRDVGSRISVSRGEVDQALERENPDGSEYEVFHILIETDPDATEEQLAVARDEATEIVQRLRDGARFGPIAVASSDASGVMRDRGNLGWRRADEMPTMFADQVVNMDTGDISDPIRSNSGFHIIMLNDKRGAERVMTTQRRARHILIQPNEIIDSQSAKDRITALRQRIVAGEDFAAIAEAESDDPGSAREGGDLGWRAPGTFVPEFEEQLAKLEPKEISEPFRSPFGWHIVELLETREHDITEEKRRNEAAAAIRARKFEEESQNWIQQLRDEAYVEIRLDDLSS